MTGLLLVIIGIGVSVIAGLLWTLLLWMALGPFRGGAI